MNIYSQNRPGRQTMLNVRQTDTVPYEDFSTAPLQTLSAFQTVNACNMSRPRLYG